MKSLRQGELFSLDRRCGLDAQLQSARKRFKQKHNCEPLQIVWNPEGFKDTKALVHIVVDKTVPPGHLWLEL
jgi:hypothetical protein